MKYDLTEVDKLFKELGYKRYEYYTGIISYIKISYIKVSNYNTGNYVTTEISANLLHKELKIDTYYNRVGDIPRMTYTEIKPELYKAIDLLLKTVGII